MLIIDDSELIDSYKKAVECQLEINFIEILEMELAERGWMIEK